MLEDLRWQLAKDKIGKENDLKLEQADIKMLPKNQPWHNLLNMVC